jgi:hypothetical protein
VASVKEQSCRQYGYLAYTGVLPSPTYMEAEKGGPHRLLWQKTNLQLFCKN